MSRLALVCSLAVALFVCLAQFLPSHRPRRSPFPPDFRTVCPDGVAWVSQSTPPDSLIIARGAWGYRFFTGRTVLECGYPGTRNLTRERIDAFLDEHPGRFRNVYLLTERDGSLNRAYADRPLTYLPDSHMVVRQLTPVPDAK